MQPAAGPSVPSFPAARESSAGIGRSTDGNDSLMRSDGAQLLDNGLLLSTATGPQWVMYVLAPHGQPMEQLELSTEAELPPEAWVGIADFHTGRWQWQPLSPGLQELTLEEDGQLSESGLFYCAILVSAGELVVSRLSLLPEDGPNQPPVASFSSDRSSGYSPLIVNFDASSSSDPDGGIVLYEWDLDGDGSYEQSGSSPLLSHSFSFLRPLSFSVGLRVTDGKGACTEASLPMALPSAWPMFGLNERHTRQSPYTGSQTGKLKWTYEAGAGIYSSPSLAADGTIYVGSIDHSLHAVNPDGSPKWEFRTKDKVYSSPTVGPDGTVCVGSDDYRLYAINPDGSLRWKFLTGYWVFSSPAFGADGTIYFGGVDSHFYALNPDGSLKWSYYPGDWVRSSPVVSADGTIFFGCYDGYFYALNPDGSLRWRFETGKGIYNSPALGPDGTVYFGSFDDNLYALSQDGELLWAFPMGNNVSSSPAVANDGTIYAGSWDGRLYAINPDSSKKWVFEAGHWVNSCPTLGADGTVYFGSANHWFYALGPDGSLKWKHRTGNWVRSSAAIASDGTVYVGSEDGRLYAFGD